MRSPFKEPRRSTQIPGTCWTSTTARPSGDSCAAQRDSSIEGLSAKCSASAAPDCKKGPVSGFPTAATVNFAPFDRRIIPRHLMGPERRASDTILIVEDDADELLLVQRALEQAGFEGQMRSVHSREELLAYVRREGDYARPAAAPRPSVIIIDLPVIRGDVCSLVRELANDHRTKTTPLLVLSAPLPDSDVCRCYESGANAVIEKPVNFDSYRAVVSGILDFWFDAVRLPMPKS